MKKALIILLFFIFLAPSLLASGLSTSEYNYINDVIGGRATGLGGAYTAISDDPSGAYYNPAGLVFAPENQISLSVNSYKNRYSKYEKVISDNDYTQEASSFYPSFFGVIQTVGNFKIGFTFVNQNTEELDQDASFTNVGANSGNYTHNYNITANTLLAGPSFATFITNNLTVGFSLYGLFRSNEEIAFQLYNYTSDGSTYFSIIDTYITEEIFGLKPILGIQYMPTDNIALGFSTTLGFVINHKREQMVYSSEYSDSNTAPTSNKRENSFEYTDSEIPTILRLGLAYFPSERLLFSVDLTGHIGEKNFQTESTHTINAAFGTEYYVFSSFPVRFGVFTNMANTPEVDSSKTNQGAHVNLLGFSSSLSWQTRNSSITVAGNYQSSNYFDINPLGEGKTQVYTDSTSVEKMDVSIYSISLTGSAKY